MDLVDRLYAEEIPAIVFRPGPGNSPGGWHGESLPEKPLVLAGSFNPLHDGHRAMLEAVSRLTGRTGFLEISIRNVDKPQLPRPELERRVNLIGQAGLALIVTSAPRFTEKSSVLPGATFLIGYDTFVRLLDDRYYPDHAAGAVSPVENSLNLIEENGCKFIVAGRLDDRGNFNVLDPDAIPARYRAMFRALGESQFRSDISSTELRNHSK